MLLLTRAGSAPYRGILLSIIFALPCAPACGDELWSRLLEDNLAKAQSGDAEAQYEVGVMYLKGQGVEPDRAAALEWLTSSSTAGNERARAMLLRIDEREAKFQALLKAAEIGDAAAQYEIGMMYLKGKGIEQERERAQRWLRKAAKQGDAKAITRLGILCYKGDLGETDYSEARRLFEQVQEGSVLAQYYLGEMYAGGHGVEKNYATAIDWYRKAAYGGFNRAFGKIINLEEEQRMQQRRSARGGQQESKPASVAPARADQPLRPEQIAKLPEGTKSSPAPLSALQKLSAKQWMSKDEPIEFLPSGITDCETEDDQLVCFSAMLQRASGNKTVQYRVKSVIRSPDNKSYEIAYRNLVLDVMVQEEQAQAEDQPPGYDADSDRGFHIQTGWTREHNVACGALSEQGLDCVKDNAHRISVVEG